MSDLHELQEQLRTQRPTPWEQLPDFPLYMDQLLSYMNRQVIHFDEGDHLTAAMVNNYTKSGLVPRATGKKYTREHIAYLTGVCVLKRVLSAKDISIVLEAELHQQRTIPQAYEAFCESLDKALGLTTERMEAYSSEEDAADAAVHFALLSYAAGLASSRYVDQLRKLQSAPEEESVPEKRHSSRREKGKEHA